MKKTKDDPRATPEGIPAYLVTLENAPEISGLIKGVQFFSGDSRAVGICDRISLAIYRRDWINPATLAFECCHEERITELALAWEDKGAKVTKVTEAEAQAERDRLQVEQKTKANLEAEAKREALNASRKRTGPPHKHGLDPVLEGFQPEGEISIVDFVAHQHGTELKR